MLQLPSCEDQYKKCPELQRDEVLKLLDWSKSQLHLPKITELEALLFLHACEYSEEAAKVCMDAYYTTRTHVPEFFSNRDVYGQDVCNQMKVSLYAPLPGLTKENYRVMFCKLLDCNASKYNSVDNLKLFSMVSDLWFLQDGIAEGYIMVVDMKGNTLAHMAKTNFSAMKKFMYYTQEALPVRLKGLHYINTVSFMDKILALMRPFMKKAILDIMHFHSNPDTFVDKYVPIEMMPNEYGGSAGTIEEIQEKTCKHLQENAQFFIEDEQTKRVDEKLRTGKPKNAKLLGIEKNFKKLEID